MASTACYRSYFIDIIITVIIILVISIFNTQCVHVLILRAVFRCACILWMMIPICASGESCHKYFLGLYLSMIMSCSVNQAYFLEWIQVEFLLMSIEFLLFEFSSVVQDFFLLLFKFCFVFLSLCEIEWDCRFRRWKFTWIGYVWRHVLCMYWEYMVLTWVQVLSLYQLTLILCQVKNVLTCGNPFYSTVQSVINVTM